MPRLYREAPLCSIWEGSGNVMALDVLRALSRTPEALDVFLDELDLAAGQDARYDAFVQTRARGVLAARGARAPRAAGRRAHGAGAAGRAAAPARARRGGRRVRRHAPGAARAACTTGRCRRAPTSRRSSTRHAPQAA